MIQQRALNTHVRVTRAAAELFCERGFAGTSVRDIAQAAGVTKGSIYFHFAAKIDLAEAVQSQASEILAASIRESELHPRHVQRVVDLHYQLADWLSHENVTRASLRLTRECGDMGPPFVNFWLDWASAARVLLERAHAAGELRPGVSPQSATALALTISAGTETLWAAGLSNASIVHTIRDHWRIVLPGMVGHENATRFLREERAS